METMKDTNMNPYTPTKNESAIVAVYNKNPLDLNIWKSSYLGTVFKFRL